MIHRILYRHYAIESSLAKVQFCWQRWFNRNGFEVRVEIDGLFTYGVISSSNKEFLKELSHTLEPPQILALMQKHDESISGYISRH